MATRASAEQRIKLANETRKRFVAEAGHAMVELGAAVQERLVQLLDEAAPSREMQDRRDAWTLYQRQHVAWVDATVKAWQAALKPPKTPIKTELDGVLELLGDDVVENKIVVSRLVLFVTEKISSELNDLHLRIKYLEGTQDLAPHDVLRPEIWVTIMIEQWVNVGMPRTAWPLISEVVQKFVVERIKPAYANANALLIKWGVLPTIEFKDRVKRDPARAARAGSTGPQAQDASQGEKPSGQDSQRGGLDGNYGAQDPGAYGDAYSGSAGSPPGPASAGGAPQRSSGGAFGGRLGWANSSPPGPAQGAAAASGARHAGSDQAPQGVRSWGNNPASEAGQGAAPAPGGSAAGRRQAPRQPYGTAPSHGAGAPTGMPSHGYGSASEETRMMTAATPLARARSRALGVMGQLKRMLIGSGGDGFEATHFQPPSPALAAAIAVRPTPGRTGAGGDTVMDDFGPAGVARAAYELRQRTAELKNKAETKSEKATIEIVALMFQAILQEERIPPGIRVWFARLQMPVLRVALAEPEFFGTIDHPARQLIDRMGSCVMGFDASGLQGSALETEVKRVVQVIEQYPETGKRVFQLVYDEFEKFLAQFLTGKGVTQKVVSVAQQVEQKETLTIQYTIEMRNMLKDLPVREEIRQFLFKVWAEVLAVAAVRKGPQHVETLGLKQLAADLVWAAGAKPNRGDRARVIQDLPKLLEKLRSGMTLLGVGPSEQDAHVKIVSDTLADAFLSKTQAIAPEQIAIMAERLANLEDFLSDDGIGDLPIDAQSIELMLGIDASSLNVVTDGGSKPTSAMLAWAQELQLGSWFSLDHNGHVAQVQMVWRSERKHLNLFASTDGRSFLIQAGRLAAYLQAGLLLAQEEETLTVRATRNALGKLEANPERLLG